ncbi:receptor like protein 23-like isoform X2 [Cornus florida]|uniref:receptor like protein 23-like isoform X2 n=1 Tax=Cornus florida TaxID=4283 RepID=UPI00289E1385|nr:receptor like protein 23-like isoform X2 [Cornus florida]
MGGCLPILFLHYLLFFLLIITTSHYSMLVQSLPSLQQQNPLCHHDDSSALIHFNLSLSIKKSRPISMDPSAYPKVASWNTSSSDCCSWDGVTCDDDTGRVIGLDLSSSFLCGFINSNNTLFRLVHLQTLNLADNWFNDSQIPSAVGLLSRLTYLNLSYSVFAGQIPLKISNLTKLTSLDLSRNSVELLKPGLTSLVQNVTNLEELYLNEFLSVQNNPDLRGYLPEFHMRSPLKELGPAGTNFFGELPNSIRNLQSLYKLDISNCNFIGSIPASIGNLAKLIFLDLSRNNFFGELPNSIGYLESLNHLDMSFCNFTGTIPYSFGNLAQLHYLEMAGCNFSGPIPSWFGNFLQLQYLDLSGNNFFGELPNSIGFLKSLNHLEMAGCNFSGPIPSWFGNFSQLQYLDLSGSNFSGELPNSIGFLESLNHLDMSNCNFTGSTPYSFSNFTHMLYLDLSNNNFDGQIPSSFANFTKLLYLDLSYNFLHGPIPESISQLVNLKYLYLHGNNLSGKLDVFLIPKNLTELVLSANQLTLLTSSFINDTLPKFEYLDQLRYLNLSNNCIQGSLPTWIWNMSTQTLLRLDLSQNFITGFHQPLPLVLPWDRLDILDLSSNMLEGSLPVPPPSTWVYNVANNKLTGKIPLLICNASSLGVLDLSYNKLSDTIPQCLGNFSDLFLVNLRNNKLHGPIPRTFKHRTQLRMINLSQNQLQGTVPKSLVNCSLLKSLDLGNNNINDIFPFWLGTLPELKVLILRFNRFHGSILNPNSSFAFPKLQILDLSHNGFTGQLPSGYFHTWTAMKTIDVNQSKYLWREESIYENYTTYAITLTNKGLPTVYVYILNSFTAIDLSSNRFEGEIPDSIGILKGLHMLRLSDNNLTGHIPSSLGNLMQLESLDISQNKLEGEIPQQLTQLTFLEFFNVSNNHLTGPIPRVSQFNTFESSSYEENSGLCGDPLPKKCGNSEASLPPPQPSNFNQGDDHSWFGIDKSDWIVICMGYGGGLVVGFIIGHTQTTRYHDWFVDTFGRNRKNQRRKKKSGRRS